MSQLDYGLIGNCQISALVDKAGRIAWCCMPKFDAPSVFASILDPERGGFWSIEPAPSDPSAKWESRQHYMRNTNVLVQPFTSSDGDQFEIVDFIPRFHRASDEIY